jgi:hypothetical protein
MAKKKSVFQNHTTENDELKKIRDHEERQAILFNAEALLPKQSYDRELEIHQLQNGTSFTLKGIKNLINELAGDYEPMFHNRKPFFKLMYKLCGWDNLDPTSFIKPPIVAVYIKKYIYARFGPDVLPTLLNKDNPFVSGYIKKYKLFQFLNDEGLAMLEGFIQDAIDEMNTCKDWYEFELKYTAKYDLPVQLRAFEK